MSIGKSILMTLVEELTPEVRVQRSLTKVMKAVGEGTYHNPTSSECLEFYKHFGALVLNRLPFDWAIDAYNALTEKTPYSFNASLMGELERTALYNSRMENWKTKLEIRSENI